MDLLNAPGFSRAVGPNPQRKVASFLVTNCTPTGWLIHRNAAPSTVDKSALAVQTAGMIAENNPTALCRAVSPGISIAGTQRVRGQEQPENFRFSRRFAPPLHSKARPRLPALAAERDHSMHRTATLLTLSTLVFLAASPARAELGAAGTRVSVAEGAPRFCMTYGHMDEPELFAPIMQDLKRLQVTFSIYGDTCVVSHQRSKLATWRVIRVRKDIPALKSKPFILEMGGSMYVPVKGLSRLLPIQLKWDQRDNLLSVVAGENKPSGLATSKGTPSAPVPEPPINRHQPDLAPEPDAAAFVPDPAATGSIELSAVALERVGDQIQVRVQASAVVRPSVLYLKAPTRIALDFPDARWLRGIPLPESLDRVRVSRVGHPVPGQARLVLEIDTPNVKVAGVEVVGGEVRTLLDDGTLSAKTLPQKEKAKLLAILRQRQQETKGHSKVVLGSRGGNPYRGAPGSAHLPQYSVQVLPERNAWKYIIIHHSASTSGNAAIFDSEHRRKGWDGLAYHFVINNGHGNPDGYLEVSPRWKFQKHGAHAGALPKHASADHRNGYNEFGIGICLVGNFQKSKPTENQLQVLAQLIQDLRTEFDIPADHVLGHGTVKGTACPGGSFPWRALYAMMDLPAPRHLHRHGANLTVARCPWCLEQETEK